MPVIAFSGSIGPVPINVVLREKHSSDLAITKVPVEVGADMTDHAYIEPKKLSLEIADGGAASTYAALERFQEARVPFTIVSGLKVYTNMLIRHIEAELDSTHGRILYGKVDLDEVLIANTAVESDAGGSFRSSQSEGSRANGAKTPNSATSNCGAAKARSSGEVARGPAVTKAVDPASTRSSSILKKLTN